MKVQPILSASELLSLPKDNLILIDATNNTFNRYKQKHLKGALYVDLNTHLAAVPDDAANGGRHPLPDIKYFAKVLGSLGITPKNHLVVYDDKQGSNAAARFWWMLRAVGHTNVQVLNGGLQMAEKEGLEMTSEAETATPAADYPITDWLLPIADLEEVRAAVQNTCATIIDVRDTERYLGIIEPLDPVGGHIENAINIPFKENVDINGLFLKPKQLYKKYLPFFSETEKDNIIVHCGSGVTACHTILALVYAGFKIPKLYVGSWSEWCRNFINI